MREKVGVIQPSKETIFNVTLRQRPFILIHPSSFQHTDKKTRRVQVTFPFTPCTCVVAARAQVHQCITKPDSFLFPFTASVAAHTQESFFHGTVRGRAALRHSRGRSGVGGGVLAAIMKCYCWRKLPCGVAAGGSLAILGSGQHLLRTSDFPNLI